MKFGKSIRAEARDNRGLAFINFKLLKRALNRCGAAMKQGAWLTAMYEDAQFRLALESELEKVRQSYWKELQQIAMLHETIRRKFGCLDIKPDPETYTSMGFDQLQAHLQAMGGLRGIPVGTSGAAPASVKTSAAVCEFCVNLGKISACCKRLRRCVLWNAVAIVKITKKREKHHASFKTTSRESAAQILARQDWYCCKRLPYIVSSVETITDELMQRLTLQPPNRDHYTCPICLDVVVDPVCLQTCGHRFCWACLCMAYCEKPEGTLERCPCCRAAFPLDPEAFRVDGILSRFLRTFFPEVQTLRVQEQRQQLRQRLSTLTAPPSLAAPAAAAAANGDEEQQSNEKKAEETSSAADGRTTSSDNTVSVPKKAGEPDGRTTSSDNTVSVPVAGCYSSKGQPSDIDALAFVDSNNAGDRTPGGCSSSEENYSGLFFRGLEQKCVGATTTIMRGLLSSSCSSARCAIHHHCNPSSLNNDDNRRSDENDESAVLLPSSELSVVDSVVGSLLTDGPSQQPPTREPRAVRSLVGGPSSLRNSSSSGSLEVSSPPKPFAAWWSLGDGAHSLDGARMKHLSNRKSASAAVAKEAVAREATATLTPLLYYYEAIDDEDDVIEAEYYLQQKQFTTTPQAVA